MRIEFTPLLEQKLDLAITLTEEEYAWSSTCINDLSKHTGLDNFIAEILQFKNGERSFMDEETEDYKKLPNKWKTYSIYYERRYASAF